MCHLEAHGRPKLVKAVLCEALSGRPETQLREKAGWGQRYMGVGPGHQWVEGWSIRTVCHLQGPVVLLGASCLDSLWVALALGDRGNHQGWTCYKVRLGR